MKKKIQTYIKRLRIKNCLYYGLLSFILSMNCFAGSSDAELLKKIRAIEKKSQTIMGITAIYIEKNKIIGHNSKKRFFMASTIKFPIALAFLHRVDEKKDSLSRKVTMDSHNSVPGTGNLHYLFEKKQSEFHWSKY